MYLRIINNEITYPYSIQQLKSDEYNVSFPTDLTSDILQEFGVYSVQQTPKPNDYTKNITEGTPQLIDGVYTQVWNQSDATQEEIDSQIQNKWDEIREIRNSLLQECDWTQLGDISSETKEVWTIYRQNLRDITNQSNPFSIDWPVKP